MRPRRIPSSGEGSPDVLSDSAYAEALSNRCTALALLAQHSGPDRACLRTGPTAGSEAGKHQNRAPATGRHSGPGDRRSLIALSWRRTCCNQIRVEMKTMLCQAQPRVTCDSITVGFNRDFHTVAALSTAGRQPCSPTDPRTGQGSQAPADANEIEKLETSCPSGLRQKQPPLQDPSAERDADSHPPLHSRSLGRLPQTCLEQA